MAQLKKKVGYESPKMAIKPVEDQNGGIFNLSNPAEIPRVEPSYTTCRGLCIVSRLDACVFCLQEKLLRIKYKNTFSTWDFQSTTY